MENIRLLSPLTSPGCILVILTPVPINSLLVPSAKTSMKVFEAQYTAKEGNRRFEASEDMFIMWPEPRSMNLRVLIF